MAQHNKTALVTGASRGIGGATTLALAETGVDVLVHYGRSTQEAESLVSEIQTKGGRSNAISADLGTPNGAVLLAKQVHSIVGDRLDVLVLNAGPEVHASPCRRRLRSASGYPGMSIQRPHLRDSHTGAGRSSDRPVGF